MKKTLLEAVIVGVLGLALALAANSLSPQGLKLSRNYFPITPDPEPSQPRSTPPPIPNLNPNPNPDLTPPPSPTDKVAARLLQKGLKLATGSQVHELFQDPRCQQGLVIFLDARDDAHYEQGHIPGAWQLDYYRYESYLPSILPACMIAQQIVVYCNGGDCEDSEFTALLLRDAQIPLEKIRVYVGGMSEWRTNGWPIETGPRNSGQINQQTTPPPTPDK